jgi:hypothetical protein
MPVDQEYGVLVGVLWITAAVGHSEGSTLIIPMQENREQGNHHVSLHHTQGNDTDTIIITITYSQ